MTSRPRLSSMIRHDNGHGARTDSPTLMLMLWLRQHCCVFFCSVVLLKNGLRGVLDVATSRSQRREPPLSGTVLRRRDKPFPSEGGGHCRALLRVAVGHQPRGICVCLSGESPMGKFVRKRPSCLWPDGPVFFFFCPVRGPDRCGTAFRAWE